MRKRNAYTVMEQTIDTVPEFETMLKKLSGQVTLRGQSKSAGNYHMSCLCFFEKHLPKHT